MKCQLREVSRRFADLYRKTVFGDVGNMEKVLPTSLAPYLTLQTRRTLMGLVANSSFGSAVGLVRDRLGSNSELLQGYCKSFVLTHVVQVFVIL